MKVTKRDKGFKIIIARKGDIIRSETCKTSMYCATEQHLKDKGFEILSVLCQGVDF